MSYFFFSEIVVQFNADIADGMPWKVVSTQKEVCLHRKYAVFPSYNLILYLETIKLIYNSP